MEKTKHVMEKTKVAIIGLGTVGSGVARLLLDFGDRTARHAGRTLWLEKVVVRDLSRARDCELPEGVLTDQIESVVDDPEIKVVAQLIGGLEPARTIMLRLLESGKDVVTANKALLAEHGPEIFDRARELGRCVAFEASVAGGIPIIANIGQCLSANQIQSLHGILNGTSNFILSKMHEEGSAYHDVVAEAQRLGYAEANPTMDVDGTDAAQKLAILAHLGFGARVKWDDIPRTGIDTLDIADVRYAQEMGYRIKLLAVAQLIDDGLQLHVSPTLELWSDRQARVAPADYANARGRFYFRVNVEDHPGVLSQITSALGVHKISIASVLQHEVPDDGKLVPLVIMTHETTEGSAAEACELIDDLDFVHGRTVRMWVRD